MPFVSTNHIGCSYDLELMCSYIGFHTRRESNLKLRSIVRDGNQKAKCVIKPTSLYMPSCFALHPVEELMWCDVMWCGVVWCDVVWCDVMWCGVVWCGAVVWCCGVMWCSVVWCGVVWCGVVWCGVDVK